MKGETTCVTYLHVVCKLWVVLLLQLSMNLTSAVMLSCVVAVHCQMAAKYREDAERWKQRLEESEAMNARLRQELAAVHETLEQMYSAGATAAAAATTLTSLSTATAAVSASYAHPITPPDSLEAKESVE